MSHRGIITDFSVTLNNRASVYGPLYFAGDVIKGYIKLELLQHLSLSCISITVKGQGYVHWTNQKLRGPGEPRFRDTQHHSASEDYFENTLILFGNGNAERPDKCYLPAGKYTYPFQCQLPANIPCSFEGEHGYVRYWVRATIEKGRELIHKTKLPFTVISPLELSLVPESNIPVQETKVKQLCCFCCLSGPITANLCLPKRGYVPGEPIRFAAEVSNLSTRRMGRVSVELKMTTVFKTLTDNRSTTQQICKVTRDQKLGRGETITWLCDQLVIPPVPPSCLTGCNIISIKYYVELRMEPVGPAFDLSLPIEIVIGTFPYRSKTDNHHQTNASNIDQSSRTSQHSQDAANHLPHRHVIGVPVLPMQGGQQVVSPAQLQRLSNQNGRQSRENSESTSHDAGRPASRASSAPSTTSTSSARTAKVSVMFAESAVCKRKLKFEEESDSKYNGTRSQFAPLYPFYYWR